MHQTDIRINVITAFDVTYEGDDFSPECYTNGCYITSSTAPWDQSNIMEYDYKDCCTVATYCISSVVQVLYTFCGNQEN